MYFVLGTVSIQSIVTIYRSCLGRPILGPCRAFVVAEVLFFFCVAQTQAFGGLAPAHSKSNRFELLISHSPKSWKIL